MMHFAWFLFFVLLFTGSVPSLAHESQPGTLEIKQLRSDRYDVIWKAPIYYGKPHPARLQRPDIWKDIVQPTERRMVDSTVFHRIVDVGQESIEGSIIRFPGLESTITDVYVRLTRLDTTMMTAVVRPTMPFVELRGERSLLTTAGEYIGLGFHHILLGVDHSRR